MSKIKDLTGQIFGRLTVLKETETPENKNGIYWECLCECGKIRHIKGRYLLIGKNKSCGCLRQENLNNFSENNPNPPKYDPKQSAARKLWSKAGRMHSTLTFDQYYDLITKNCFYCDKEPHMSTFGYQKTNIKLFYNSIDRYNSNIDYTLDNCRSSCLFCNLLKLDQPIQEFLQQLHRIKNYIRPTIEEFKTNALLIDDSKLSNDTIHYPLITTVKRIFKNYNDGDLTLNQFYKFSQMKCYYCDGDFTNSRLKFCEASSEYVKNYPPFKYNGLDRIISKNLNRDKIPHNLDNIITSCKYCNVAKNDYSFEEFTEWLDRIKYSAKLSNLMTETS